MRRSAAGVRRQPRERRVQRDGPEQPVQMELMRGHKTHSVRARQAEARPGG